METFIMPVQIRWADIDPNLHLRHSVYYDWGAMCRMNYLDKKGITLSFMQKHGFGAVIFREETRFLKEIMPDDTVTIGLKMASARKDFSRWTIQHEIRKGDILAAVITVEGAWIDTRKRKLFAPPTEVKVVFENIDHGAGFEWTD